MRNRIIYLLKHNLFLQSVYKIVLSMVFRCVSLFIKVDNRMVLFSSFMGKGINDSPKAVFDYMQQHPKYNGYRCIWAVEDPQKYPHFDTVKIDTFSYFITAFKAKYWVTNTNIERGLSFKKNSQVYLNTWHGIALKKIGNDCPGRKDYNFSTVNYLVVSGKYDEKIFKSAFNANEKTYLRCGMPRNERLWHVTEKDKRNMCNKLQIPIEKKVILYAPTWRDSQDGGKSYSIKPPIDFEKWKTKLGNDYIVLLRAHHQTTKVLNVQYNEFVRDVSDYPDINDLMIAADILITDYSAIAFDYSILCRPIFCYAYDYNTYLESRGTYFEIDGVYPEKSCRTEEQLLDNIQNLDYEKAKHHTEIFRNCFVQYRDNSTQKCVESLFECQRELQ